MTLFKSKWKTTVLMMGAVGLLFAGGAFATWDEADPCTNVNGVAPTAPGDAVTTLDGVSNGKIIACLDELRGATGDGLDYLWDIITDAFWANPPASNTAALSLLETKVKAELTTLSTGAAPGEATITFEGVFGVDDMWTALGVAAVTTGVDYDAIKLANNAVDGAVDDAGEIKDWTSVNGTTGFLAASTGNAGHPGGDKGVYFWKLGLIFSLPTTSKEAGDGSWFKTTWFEPLRGLVSPVSNEKIKDGSNAKVTVTINTNIVGGTDWKVAEKTGKSLPAGVSLVIPTGTINWTHVPSGEWEQTGVVYLWRGTFDLAVTGNGVTNAINIGADILELVNDGVTNERPNFLPASVDVGAISVGATAKNAVNLASITGGSFTPVPVKRYDGTNATNNTSWEEQNTFSCDPCKSALVTAGKANATFKGDFDYFWTLTGTDAGPAILRIRVALKPANQASYAITGGDEWQIPNFSISKRVFTESDWSIDPTTGAASLTNPAMSGGGEAIINYQAYGSTVMLSDPPLFVGYRAYAVGVTSGDNFEGGSFTSPQPVTGLSKTQDQNEPALLTTPMSAEIACSLATYQALYTRDETGFKITSSGDPKIYILDSLKGGRFGGWKPWKIKYIAPGDAKSKTYTTTSGQAWTAFDKGVQVGMLTDQAILASQANGLTPDEREALLDRSKDANIIGFGDIAGLWKVEVYMVNMSTQRSVRNTHVKTTVNFNIVPRSLTDRDISVTATLTDRVFNGSDKSELVRVEVWDGQARLTQGVHFEVLELAPAKDTGVYIATAKGMGPYMNTKSANYTVTRQVIRMDMTNPGKDYAFTKEYDGTTAIDTSDYAFEIKFVNNETSELIKENFVRGDDYTVTNLKYTNANAGNDKTVTATVALNPRGELAKNYRLVSGVFSVSKQVIEKAVPRDSMITLKMGSRSFILPARIPEDSRAGKTLEPSWTSPYASSGAKFTIVYPENWPKGTRDTLPQGDYSIKINITEGSNTAAINELDLGTLTIKDPNEPDIAEYRPAGKDTSYYSTKPIKIAVVGANPEGGRGTLSYQWYLVREGENGDSLLRGKTSSELTLNDVVTTATPLSYYAVVTYTAPNEQKSASVKSDNIAVTVYPKPVSLAAAIITPNQSYVYNGLEQAITSADFTVTLGDAALNAGEHFTFKGARNNKLAGEGIIVIKGINAYEDSAVGTFEIAKKPVDFRTDLNIKYSVSYTGAPQTLAVTPVSPLSGLGAVTVIIDEEGATRTGAGEWPVSIAVDEGTNFEKLDTTLLPQNFRIRKAIPDTSMFTYTVEDKAFTGSPITVAAPAAKGLGTFYTNMATNEVLYNGSATAPSAIGVYTVELSVKGDGNFSSYVIRLGTMTIFDPTISVAEGSREIPTGSAVTEAAVAPVKAAAAGVTFGPNPVSAGSSVAIFWNGSKPVAGKLAVFTEMGRKVEIVKVSGSKKIGTWNTAGAPAGTYLIKGVLKDRDGNKVTVNSVVNVGK